ncbi:hypothetical protein, partial [Paenibacillus sp. Soil724D2]|uniref:hypothetical protein n=1 Tax=Paenibacillus sp. (strain Soil724D2) TaxID=1736392 RepID=UPI001F3C991B
FVKLAMLYPHTNNLRLISLYFLSLKVSNLIRGLYRIVAAFTTICAFQEEIKEIVVRSTTCFALLISSPHPLNQKFCKKRRMEAS